MEIVLLCISIVLQIAILIVCVQRQPVKESQQEPVYQNPYPEHITFSALRPHEDHEILELRDGQWQHHSWRCENHPDISIYSKHKRFNVRRPDGSLLRGSE